jgi:hypothetical protein
VLTLEEERVPAVVEKKTGAATRTLPFTSKTLAVIVDEPPNDDTDEGEAPTFTRPTAAEPTKIFRAPALPVVAPPDEAVIEAAPLAFPATNCTVAPPLASVVAVAG